MAGLSAPMGSGDLPRANRTRDTVEASMQELWSGASYEPHLLSLPFALAPTAMLIVIAYTAVMRGAPILRAYLLAHFISLLPYGTVVMLSPSITSPEVAEQLFKFGACTI